MVHRRQVDGETLVFGVHGALWGNAMTWWDHDTGSVWSQPLGKAIVGPREGQTLELLPSAFSTWGAWLDEHPDSLALDAPAPPSGFDLGELYIVVDFSEEVRAYPVADLREVGVVNDVVAGVEIAVVSDPRDGQRWAVLTREAGGRVVELEVRGDQLHDPGSGTDFEPTRGLGVGGELDGEILQPLAALTSFPGDFDTFWPEGTVWMP